MEHHISYRSLPCVSILLVLSKCQVRGQSDGNESQRPCHKAVQRQWQDQLWKYETVFFSLNSILFLRPVVYICHKNHLPLKLHHQNSPCMKPMLHWLFYRIWLTLVFCWIVNMVVLNFSPIKNFVGSSWKNKTHEKDCNFSFQSHSHRQNIKVLCPPTNFL